MWTEVQHLEVGVEEDNLEESIGKNRPSAIVEIT